MSDDRNEVRLALNVPVLGGAHTPAAQHVAFACDDALRLARQVRHRGVAPLPVPGNFYDDLAARTDLDAELLDALRANDVLYDREPDGGELLHFYLPAVGRLFVEVLERRGGYPAYGAPNSPVRLAVQRRFKTA